jgi:hypothetical protein
MGASRDLNQSEMELQKADPGARRAAAFLVAIAAVVGAGTILLTRSYFPDVGEWIAEDPAAIVPRVRTVAVVLSAALAVPTLAVTVYLWLTGARIVRAEQFPPPGAAVTRDTVVLRGAAARRRGRTLQVLGGILALAAAGLVTVLWRLVWLLEARIAD